MRKPEDTEAYRKAADELLRYMKAMPRSTDPMRSTWCPPDWEQVVGWWDRAKDIAEGKL